MFCFHWWLTIHQWTEFQYPIPLMSKFPGLSISLMTFLTLHFIFVGLFIMELKVLNPKWMLSKSKQREEWLKMSLTQTQFFLSFLHIPLLVNQNFEWSLNLNNDRWKLLLTIIITHSTIYSRRYMHKMEENNWLQVKMTLIKLKFRLITSQGMNLDITGDCHLISLKLENMFTFYPQIHFPITDCPRKGENTITTTKWLT